jgi:hypothetical protein
MKVHLRQIPQGGTLSLEGEEDPGFLDLGSVEAEACGLLRYALEAGLSGGGFFATGRLAVRVRMRCVVTLEAFEEEIVVPAFAVQKELDGRELVDLSQEIREEIHLALPSHPRSRKAGELGAALPDGPQSGRTQEPSGGVWQALDHIQPTKN